MVHSDKEKAFRKFLINSHVHSVMAVIITYYNQIYVFLWMCVPDHACVCGVACAHMHSCLWRPEVNVSSIVLYLIFFFSQGLSVNLKFTDLVDQLAGEPQESFCLCLTSRGNVPMCQGYMALLGLS